MKINKKNALRLWEERYGVAQYAADFHGNLMYRDAFGDREYVVYRGEAELYCGWNIHHIMPVANGGSDEKSNLLCTNIITNDEAEDKITFWIDDCLYQVQHKPETSEYQIVQLQ